MRKALFFALAIFMVGVLAGCSGGGAATPTTVTRFITGFIYVKGDGGGGTGPGAVVSNSSNPPTGYFAPDSGVLHVAAPAGGDVSTRAPFIDIDVSTNPTGNSFILKVTGLGDGSAQVSFSTLTPFARSAGPTVSAKSITSYAVNMGATANNNTTLTVASTSDFTYVPGPPAALSVTVDGAAPAASETFVSGKSGGYALACAVLDANGVAISGVPVTFSSQNVPNAGTARTTIASGVLTPAAVPTAATAGAVMVQASISAGASLLQQFSAQFSFGTATSIALSAAGNKATLLWDVPASPAALDTLALTGTIKNENGVAMPGAAFTWTGSNVTAGNWNNANGPAFATATSGNADASGNVAMTFDAPVKKAAVLGATDKALKGANTITLASGTANNLLNYFLLRPLATITTSGPSRLDAKSATKGTYNITGGTDVDNDAVAIARIVGPFVWTPTPLGNAGGTILIGDPDDQSARSVANSTTDGSTGITMMLTPGTNAGQESIVVTNGTISSVPIVTDIVGTPSKIHLNPAPTATGYHGASGFVEAFTVSTFDAFGHAIAAGEVVYNSKTGATDSNSGANIQFPPLPDLSFTVTAGQASGFFTVVMGGTWTGTVGGSGTFSIQRHVNIAIP